MESIDRLREYVNVCTDHMTDLAGFSVPHCVNAFIDSIEAEIAERYAELPKDADGETIHIGDRVENNERVARIVLTDDSWEPSVYVEKLSNVLHEHFCNEISHYHKPTVEDVLTEFASNVLMATCMDDHEVADAIERFAPKLRLAGDE